jgi:hypothetical protein
LDSLVNSISSNVEVEKLSYRFKNLKGDSMYLAHYEGAFALLDLNSCEGLDCLKQKLETLPDITEDQITRLMAVFRQYKLVNDDYRVLARLNEAEKLIFTGALVDAFLTPLAGYNGGSRDRCIDDCFKTGRGESILCALGCFGGPFACWAAVLCIYYKDAQLTRCYAACRR